MEAWLVKHVEDKDTIGRHAGRHIHDDDGRMANRKNRNINRSFILEYIYIYLYIYICIKYD